MSSGLIQCLWVDDEIETIKPAASHLASQLNWKISFAATASSALRRLSSNSYDYVFLDNLLPLGSEKILEDEFEIRLDPKGDVGFRILEFLLSQGKIKGVRRNNLRGIVFCSGYPIESKLKQLTTLDPERVHDWPKYNLHSAATEVPASLIEFIENAASLPSIGSKVVETHNANDQLRKSIDVQHGSYYLPMVKTHVHEQGRAIRTLSTHLDALIHSFTSGGGILANSWTDLVVWIEAQLLQIGELLDEKSGSKNAGVIKAIDDVDMLISGVAETITNTDYEASEYIRVQLSQLRDESAKLGPEVKKIASDIWTSFNGFYTQNLVFGIKDGLVGLATANHNLISELENPETPNQTEIVDAANLIDTIIRAHEPYANFNRNTNIRRYFPAEDKATDAHLIKADFRAVFDNLVDNAIKHGFQMPRKPSWINVRLKLTRNFMHISVENWGSRISNRIDIYSPDARGRDSLSTGSGQGLALCKSISDRNGWKLNHTSELANEDGGNTEVQGRPAYLNTFSFRVRRAST